MPCRTDHLEPTEREQHLRGAAKVAATIQIAMFGEATERAKAAASHCYGEPFDDSDVERLCSLCSQAPLSFWSKNIAKCVENGHTDFVVAYQWWVEHKDVDQRRRARE